MVLLLLFLSPSNRGYQKRLLNIDSALIKMISNMELEFFEITKIIGLDISPILGCFQAYNSIYQSNSIANNSLFKSKLRETFIDLPIFEEVKFIP